MHALLCSHGVQSGEIWQMTYGEAASVAQAIERREYAQREMQATIAWKTAEMVGQYIAYMFAKSAPRPQSLYQAFPWLEKPEEDWQVLKARFAARAETHNVRVADRKTER